MTQIEALRIAITTLTANLALLEGKNPTTYLGQILPIFDTDAAEKKRLEEIAESLKPHAWRPWAPGTPPDQVGDNDTPDDEFLRAFQPMMEAAAMQQFKDSTGATFFFPNIKARTGLGWLGVKNEALRMVLSDWGQNWMAQGGNRAPSASAIARLMQQVTGT